MPFTSTITGRAVLGNKRVVYGTYTSTGGSTGGTVSTKLGKVDAISFTGGTSSVTQDPRYTSISGGDVVLSTAANDTGRWRAEGSGRRA